ncbi:site-specific tyrosine recombinase XerD [Streptococcus suis]|uniref:site-specific tyrosine recombinase XerD n=1 Tax=Streptococcus suis TaxID=1307 RepID=UPI001ABE3FE4|nr:site-specific tyrosine recombinase XerD [Streptococcus suis]
MTSDLIVAFLQEKRLSVPSQQAYKGDLQQFLEVCPRLDQSGLVQYQTFLQGLKPTAQRRKVSAVNQFIYFLYTRGQVECFYKLDAVSSPILTKKRQAPVHLDALWQETELLDGQLMALLMSQLGLTPSELIRLKGESIDLNFQVLTLERGGQKRILSLPKSLLPYLADRNQQVYLFDKQGQPYSRQWFFNRLSEYVGQLGHREWTAQFLREQFILSRLAAGQSLEQIAKDLGLKTSISLEKYK